MREHSGNTVPRLEAVHDRGAEPTKSEDLARARSHVADEEAEADVLLDLGPHLLHLVPKPVFGKLVSKLHELSLELPCTRVSSSDIESIRRQWFQWDILSSDATVHLRSPSSSTAQSIILS